MTAVPQTSPGAPAQPPAGHPVLPIVTVVLPPALREAAGGRRRLTVRAADVGGALRALADAEPLLGRRICDELGALRPHLLLFVGDSDVRLLDGFATRLTDGSELHVLTAVSGG